MSHSHNESDKMKILSATQQPAIAQQIIDSRTEVSVAGKVSQQTAVKTAPARDTVRLSGSIDTELKKRQAEQSMRVESIKAQVTDGKYQVSSLAVAEKMLSGSARK